MENKEILKELRSIMGLNRREFAEYFCIPYRTVQEWELAHRNMPDYLLRLMLYSEKLRSENKFYSASKNVSISELPIVLSQWVVHNIMLCMGYNMIRLLCHLFFIPIITLVLTNINKKTCNIRITNAACLFSFTRYNQTGFLRSPVLFPLRYPSQSL